MTTELPLHVAGAADARLGTVLRGKYRLDRVIGTGGMAIVYKATHRNLAEFAVKMLRPELSLSEDIRTRFLREGYAANAVKHPGAVLVVDDDVAEDGAAFLVMELLDGVSCDQVWGSVGKQVSAELASAVAIQLLDVLAAAHEKGIIHRDIKPANLFLTRVGLVKVLDFGIAKAREAMEGAHATGSGMSLGTPAFMAPEHARGRARDMDGRTDLWAVGATFFAMVSGQLVHAAETANEFLIAAGTKPARSLATAAPSVPAALVEVIERALAFEKADRWPDASAMRDALMAAPSFLWRRGCGGGGRRGGEGVRPAARAGGRVRLAVGSDEDVRARARAGADRAPVHVGGDGARSRFAAAEVAELGGGDRGRGDRSGWIHALAQGSASGGARAGRRRRGLGRERGRCRGRDDAPSGGTGGGDRDDGGGGERAGSARDERRTSQCAPSSPGRSVGTVTTPARFRAGRRTTGSGDELQSAVVPRFRGAQAVQARVSLATRTPIGSDTSRVTYYPIAVRVDPIADRVVPDAPDVAPEGRSGSTRSESRRARSVAG